MAAVKDYFNSKSGGWVPDIPDCRDYCLSEDELGLRERIEEISCFSGRVLLPDENPEFFAPVEAQGLDKTSTACACAALVEYCNRRFYGRCKPVLRTFLHDVARQLHGLPVNSSVSIRQVLKALVRYGVPPQDVSANQESEFSTSNPMLYGFANDYRDVTYLRLIPLGDKDLLHTVKATISLGLPCVFGMPQFATLTTCPMIDCRPDEVVGGMAGMLVGFDDDLRISSCGAFRFRSTCGPDWGESGYGWFSYRFVERGYVPDIWTIFSPEWISMMGAIDSVAQRSLQ